MKKLLALSVIVLGCVTYIHSQNNTCLTADPFCTNMSYNFPAGVNAGTAEVGPNYVCLYTQPNPVWYYLLIDQPGNISISITTSPQRDVDFICWGPFTSQTGPCTSQLTAPNNPGSHWAPGPGGGYPTGNTIDCSYDASYQEWCYIPNALQGQYYLLLITNYSNQPCNLVFNQIPSGYPPGDGTTNCNEVTCNFDNITYTVNPCDPATNEFSVDGSMIFHFDPPQFPVTTGILTITDQPSGISQTFNPPFTSPTNFSLTGIIADGQQHTLTGTFSDAPGCTFTVTYTAPGPCSQCIVNGGSNVSTCGLAASINAIEQPSDNNTHWYATPGITYGTINSPTSTITAAAPGTYNLVWEITNSFGSTCQDTITATFLTIPTASFAVPPALCEGNSITATYTGTGGNNFVWSFPNGNPNIAFTQGPHNVTYSTPGTQTISLFVTSSNGCVSDTVTQNITVNPLPSSAFTAASPVCVNNPSTVTGPSGSVNYFWTYTGSPTVVPGGNSPGPHTVTWSTVGVQTVTLYVINTATGCTSAVSTQQVQVLDSSTPNCCLTPNPNAGTDQSVCGLSATLSASMPAPGNTASWSVIPPAPGTVNFGSQTQYNSPVMVSQPGTYTFQWTEISGACDSLDQVTITFTEQPFANAGDKTQICGLVMTLDATYSITGSTGTWTTVAPNMASFSPDDNTANATATAQTSYGDYFFVWTEQNGPCSSSDTVWKVFLEVPVTSAGNDFNTCGNTAQLFADSLYPGWWTASSPNVIYSDNYTDPNPSIWIPAPTQTYYQLQFVWHAVNGICPASDTIVVTFVKPPLAEAGLTQSICGTQAQLFADTIGTAIVSAYWTSSVPAINISYTGPDPIPWNPDVDASSLVPGFWQNSQRPVYFYWIATNGPGCSSIDSVLVTFYQIPEANAGLDTAVCGKNFTFDGDWSITNPSGIWTPLPPNPGSANFSPNNDPNAVVTVTQYGDYNFIWKEMNAGSSQCYDQDTIHIVFDTVPMPDAGLDFKVCGHFAHIQATPSFPDGYWSETYGLGAYYDTINGNYAPTYKDSASSYFYWGPPNDTVTLYWYEFNGLCNGYDSVNITFLSIEPAIEMVGAADTVVCGPVFTILNAQNPTYGSGHYWIDTVPNTTFTPSPMNPGPTSAIIDTGSDDYYGYHNFYWITVNDICRDTSDLVRVKFIKYPEAYAGGNYWPGLFGPNSHIKTDTVCGLNTQMGAIPSIGQGSWYSLDPSNVYFVQGNGTSTPVYNDSLYLTCAGCYTVFNMVGDKYREFVWQENNEGCVHSDTIRLYFAPHPTGTFTVTMPWCRHYESMIIATTWPAPNNVDYGITSFQWTYPNGVLSPQIPNPAVSDTIYVSWPTGETHNVTLITSNQWDCSSGVVSHTVIEPQPFSVSSLQEPASCLQDNGSVTLSTSYGQIPQYYTFHWFPDSLYPNPLSVTQDGLSPFSYHTVQVTGESYSVDAPPGTNCYDTLTFFVRDTGAITAHFDTITLQQHQAAPYDVQFVNQTINGKKYSWRIYDENGNLVYSSTAEHPAYSFDEEGCYEIVLIATSKFDCRDTAAFMPLCVDAVPVLEIPNVFTPNNDGMNDLFRVHGKSIVEFKAIIFNRWGKKVYEWDDVNGYWDGKVGSSDAAPGTYYYIITAKDKKDVEYEEKGFFYLLREK